MPQMEIIRGQSRNRTVAERLAEVVRAGTATGTLYLGYPVLASADSRIHVDALLVSREHGLVAFLFEDVSPTSPSDSVWVRLQAEQDRLYAVLESYLGRHEGLWSGRRLAVAVETMTILPSEPDLPPGILGRYCGLSQVNDTLSQFAPLDERFLRPLEAAVQHVTTIKPTKKRANVSTPNSRGAVLKEIERHIANLDRWQKEAAIESPEGPQRIRGLAGSGKTIVLAQKAAYFHAQYPEWTIAVTFWTRSLHQQFKDLIRRFSYEHTNDEPDWTKLRILHAWGANNRDGIYGDIVNSCGLPRRDFVYAKATFGWDNAFSGVCGEALSGTVDTKHPPLFDAVLIDEAQDLPPSFFQLVYRFTKTPKRIVWAFDELQKLSEAGMPSTKELFGTNESGVPRIELASVVGEPRQDIILPKCYRNPPWTLSLAHSLGLGIYRKGGLVQHFDDPGLWAEVGYSVVQGELTPGKPVALKRDSSSYPEYFPRLIGPDDGIVVRIFKDTIEQATWVAAQIRANLDSDELDIDDILIVLPEALTAKKRAPVFINALQNQGLRGHLAGVNSSQDELFVKDSVAISHIFRAKGNEAPMVYVVDAQDCAAGFGLITLRNTLFTAITRTRAWVRLVGVGDGMKIVADEVKEAKSRDFRIEFVVPTQEQLKEMRTIHRERTPHEEQEARKAERGLEQFLKALNEGHLDWAHLPERTRKALQTLIAARAGDDDDVDAE